jgi:hypothetical protein
VFIDQAVREVAGRLALPERLAIARLLQAIREGWIETWTAGYDIWLQSRRRLPQKIAPQWWDTAEIDLEPFRGSGPGCVEQEGRGRHLYRFLIDAASFAAWLNQLVPEKAAKANKRAPNGRNYRKDDAPIVADMRNLIVSSPQSPESAARCFVKRAIGGGTDDSKVKRLALHYRETYPAEV